MGYLPFFFFLSFLCYYPSGRFVFGVYYLNLVVMEEMSVIAKVGVSLLFYLEFWVTKFCWMISRTKFCYKLLDDFKLNNA